MLKKAQSCCVHKQWMECICNSSLQRVILIFLTCHAGIKSDKRADSLASIATLASDRAVDRADILNAVRDTCLAEDGQTP